MQVDECSRPFKASSKSRTRAEVSLAVVIVISFSWSAYALYKIATGSTDTSIFGFNLATNKQQTSGSRPIGKHQTSSNGGQVVTAPLELPSDLSPDEQLAIYKSEILKELLARQRKLLTPNSQQQAAPDSGPLLSPKLLLERLRQQQQQNAAQADFGELSRWRGGFSVPNSLSRMQAEGAQTLANEQQKSGDSAKVKPRGTDIQQKANASSLGNFLLLDEAPSLGQLSLEANRQARAQAEARLKLKQQQQQQQQRRQELQREADRQPEESSLNEEQAEQDKDDAESVTAASTTTTTVAPPPLESTTAQPEVVGGDQSDSAISDSEQANEPEPNSSSSSSDQDQDQEQETSGNNEPSDKDSGSTEDSSSTEKVDEESLNRARKAVNAIDEEVDRMTQPSSGSVSQHKEASQAGSVDYKNGVQFDDQAEPLGVARRRAPVNRRSSKIRPSNDSETDPLEAADLDAKSRTTSLLGPPLTQTSRIITLARDLDVGSNRRSRSKRATATAESLAGTQPPSSDAKTSNRHRRNNEADEDESADDDDDDDEGEQQHHQQVDEVSETEQPDKSAAYHYTTATEPSFDELMAHKQLLDSLRQTRPLPAPLAPVSGVNESSAAVVQAAGASQGLVEHQPAAGEGVYTLDDGLLLTPAGNEDHEHKSMEKKKMKKKEHKHKKKMTMAVKKGGHKKKKHKKEEKKYLKEKKFKGAKKGKKMSKGKGGKGGKKGSKFFKDKGFKKKGFKNIYVKNEFGQKKSYFDEFRDKNFKKKWKNFDDKYNYAQMKKWQAKDVKGAKKMKDQGEKYKKYDKGKWKKKYHKQQASESSKKKKKFSQFR